jgi:serine/threonine-protein kinase HipA
MMSSRCLYCYNPTTNDEDYHDECKKKFFGNIVETIVPYSFNEIAELAKLVVSKSITVPGVQTKLSLKLSNNSELERFTLVGFEGDYILKPPSEKFPSLPENEDLIMKMADLFEIDTVPHSLIRLKSGELSYITKRIDRVDNRKIHMEDFCQLSGKLTESKYKSSSESLGKILLKFSSNPIMDTIELFKIILFSFIVGNNDMHLKNFSLIYYNYGIRLAPAYDLLSVMIALPEDEEELALQISGKKKNITKKHFYNLAKSYRLNKKQVDNIFSMFEQGASKCEDLINISFLSIEKKEELKIIIQNRIERLFT